MNQINTSINISFTENEMFIFKNYKNCPIHPGYQLIFLSLDTNSKQHLQCSLCVAHQNYQNLIPLLQLISSDQNTIFKKWPIQDDQEIYEPLVEISSQKPFVQDLETKISDYFNQLRSRIDKKLDQKQKQMIKQLESLQDINENAILQYNKFAAKEELKDIIYNKKDDFLQQNRLLNETVKRILLEQDRCKQQLIDSINQTKSKENLINFDIPNQTNDNIIQLIDKIDMFKNLDFQNIQIPCLQDNLNFLEDKFNKIKHSDITTSQHISKLIKNSMENCSKPAIDSLQHIINKLSTQIDKVDIKDYVNEDILDVDIDKLDEKQFQKYKFFQKSIADCNKSEEQQIAFESIREYGQQKNKFNGQDISSSESLKIKEENTKHNLEIFEESNEDQTINKVDDEIDIITFKGQTNYENKKASQILLEKLQRKEENNYHKMEIPEEIHENSSSNNSDYSDDLLKSNTTVIARRRRPVPKYIKFENWVNTSQGNLEREEQNNQNILEKNNELEEEIKYKENGIQYNYSEKRQQSAQKQSFENSKKNKQQSQDNSIENTFNQETIEKVDQIFSNQKLERYSKSKYLIYKHLQDKKYILSNYLLSGGEADCFEGSMVGFQGIKQDVVFKILHETDLETFYNEINIMKSFENKINIVNFIDSVIINTNENNYNIIVLEKCKYSLLDELVMFQKRDLPFDFKMLLKIIFDCLDGMNQLRVNDTIHFDIKPSNILKNQEDQYCFSDFGVSSKKFFKNDEFQALGFSLSYSPKEQIEDSNLGFHCDIYSMGKTLLRVLKIFESLNQNLSEQQAKIVQTFKIIINQNMIQDDYKNRKDCLEIHSLFFENLQNNREFLKEYQKQINKIIGHFSYNENNDSLYISQLKQQYFLKQQYIRRFDQSFIVMYKQITFMLLNKFNQNFKDGTNKLMNSKLTQQQRSSLNFSEQLLSQFDCLNLIYLLLRIIGGIYVIKTGNTLCGGFIVGIVFGLISGYST